MKSASWIVLAVLTTVAPTLSIAQASPAPLRETQRKRRVRLNIPAGTRLPVEIEATISSRTTKERTAVFAHLTESVALEGFKLDRGAEVRGLVTQSTPGQGNTQAPRLVIQFDAVMESGEKLSIETEPVDSLSKRSPAVRKGDQVEIPRGAKLILIVTK
ncbi:MAG: hypothetical protein ABI672_02535 [Vicinamibacteria bacterium]